MKDFRLFRIIIIALVTFCVTACGPVAKLRKAERLIEQAIAKGAKVDSSKYIKYDTLTVRAFRDAFKTTIDVNPTFMLEKCKELIAAKPESVRPIIVEVQEKVCPDIAIDTTYNLEIDSPEGQYKLPVHVKVKSKGGTSDMSIDAGKLAIPVRTETNKIKISAGYSLWQMIILAIVSALVGAGAMALFKK
jgi:hypothetical protein